MFDPPHNIPRMFGTTEATLSAFRAVTDEMERAGTLTSGRGDVLVGGVRSRYLVNAQTNTVEFSFYAEIIDSGPGEEDTNDRAGCLYWLQAQAVLAPDYGNGDGVAADFVRDDSINGFIVEGTNLAERRLDTHFCNVKNTDPEAEEESRGDIVEVRLVLNLRSGDPETAALPASNDKFTFYHQPEVPQYYITSVKSGTAFPKWTYMAKRVLRYDSSYTSTHGWVLDETEIEMTNTAEFAPTGGYPYTYGNGSSIDDSDGTVTDTTCVIIPIGPGTVVSVRLFLDPNGDVVYVFTAMNSAGMP